MTVGRTEGGEFAQPLSALRGSEGSWAKMVDEPRLCFLPMAVLRLDLHGMKEGLVGLEARAWGTQACLWKCGRDGLLDGSDTGVERKVGKKILG